MNTFPLKERSSFLSYQKIVQEIEHLRRLHVAHQFMMADVCVYIHT